MPNLQPSPSEDKKRANESHEKNQKELLAKLNTAHKNFSKVYDNFYKLLKFCQDHALKFPSESFILQSDNPQSHEFQEMESYTIGTKDLAFAKTSTDKINFITKKYQHEINLAMDRFRNEKQPQLTQIKALFQHSESQFLKSIFPVKKIYPDAKSTDSNPLPHQFRKASIRYGE